MLSFIGLAISVIEYELAVHEEYVRVDLDENPDAMATFRNRHGLT